MVVDALPRLEFVRESPPLEFVGDRDLPERRGRLRFLLEQRRNLLEQSIDMR